MEKASFDVSPITVFRDVVFICILKSHNEFKASSKSAWEGNNNVAPSVSVVVLFIVELIEYNGSTATSQPLKILWWDCIMCSHI